jgi:hypothetical protein
VIVALVPGVAKCFHAEVLIKDMFVRVESR